MSAPLRTVFFGTPPFAATLLRALTVNSPAPVEVVLVVTQPDQPAGRGRALRASAVKEEALRRGLPVAQPERVRGDARFLDQLRALAPDLLVVASYGQILPQELLDVPRLFALNVHGSLLPAYRGASPIQQAILDGVAETGITYMRMDAGLDTGDVVTGPHGVVRVPVGQAATTATLTDALAGAAARTLATVIDDARRGSIAFAPQGAATTPVTRLVRKADGQLHFADASAAELERRVRAMDPWPGATVAWGGQPLRVWAASAEASSAAEPPGTVLPHSDGCAVVCREGLLVLREVQAAGKKRVAIRDFLNGAREFLGSQLGG